MKIAPGMGERVKSKPMSLSNVFGNFVPEVLIMHMSRGEMQSTNGS